MRSGIARLALRALEQALQQVAVVVHDSRDEAAHGAADELTAIGAGPDEVAALAG